MILEKKEVYIMMSGNVHRKNFSQLRSSFRMRLTSHSPILCQCTPTYKLTLTSIVLCTKNSLLERPLLKVGLSLDSSHQIIRMMVSNFSSVLAIVRRNTSTKVYWRGTFQSTKTKIIIGLLSKSNAINKRTSFLSDYIYPKSNLTR